MSFGAGQGILTIEGVANCSQQQVRRVEPFRAVVELGHLGAQDVLGKRGGVCAPLANVLQNFNGAKFPATVSRGGALDDCAHASCVCTATVGFVGCG